MSIWDVDMHLRDQRVLDWIREQASTQACPTLRITHSEVAQVVKCHRHTAAAILQRLIWADHLRLVNANSKRLGYEYEVVKHA
jgi:hypothetical protein